VHSADASGDILEYGYLSVDWQKAIIKDVPTKEGENLTTAWNTEMAVSVNVRYMYAAENDHN